MRNFDRRRFLVGGLGLVGAAALGGCDQIASTRAGRSALQAGEDASKFVQRLLLTPQTLAREYSDADISRTFKPNGSTDPDDEDYRTLADGEFRYVPAQVQRPRRTPVRDFAGGVAGAAGAHADHPPRLRRGLELHRQMERRAARPAAVAGGAEAAGALRGVPLLRHHGRQRRPRFRQKPHYYESVDLVDAFHPQTIVAYDLNGAPLKVEHGAPLRLRVERQLGYKMPKYLREIEVVESYAAIDGGRGGYWEDQGYDWYAGI